MKSKYLLFSLIIILFLGLIFLIPQLQKSTTQISPTPTSISSETATSSAILGIQIKTSGCQAQGPLPDKDCTPGAIFPTVTKEQVCTPGYASSVRNVPQSEKDQVFAEYGIVSHQPGEYEIDHLISLELGGSNEIANLFPEAAEPKPGFHEKDRLENFLHSQVCNGSIPLQQAQLEISQNWLQIYNQSPH